MDLRCFFPNTQMNKLYIFLGLQDGISKSYCYKEDRKMYIPVESIVKSNGSLRVIGRSDQLLVDPQV